MGSGTDGDGGTRTVFQHRLFAVLAEESRELGLGLLDVVGEVVATAPLAMEGPVRLLALSRAEVRGVASRAQREVLRRAAVVALVEGLLLLLIVGCHGSEGGAARSVARDAKETNGTVTGRRTGVQIRRGHEK